MPELFITAAEVISIAIPNENLREEFIKDQAIKIAQENCILPALGSNSAGTGLYDKLVNTATLMGDYKTLMDDYVKPALAFFIKYQVTPDIFTQLTNTGLMFNNTENSQQASNRDKDIYRAQARSDADSLVKKMIRFIESDAMSGKFPEYSPGDSSTHRIGTDGGIILRKRNRKSTGLYY